MNIFRTGIGALAMIAGLLALNGCTAKKNPAFDAEAYKKGIVAWQTKRAARISAEDGWISLAGLFWLKPGENTFGSDSLNSMVLPHSVPSKAGSLILRGDSVTLVTKKNSGVKVNDSSVVKTRLRSDADSTGTDMVSLGSVNFYVIKRADRVGVRAKDKQSPARLNFAGLRFFPVDTKWRTTGTFTKFETPLKMAIPTVIGTVDTFPCPGEVSFVIGDSTVKLLAMTEQGSEDKLYFMFSDETSGRETYGAGRQLYSPLPDSVGNVDLDFNQSINWPCAYTPYATCPIPPSRNHLKIRIEAGEQLYLGKTGE